MNPAAGPQDAASGPTGPADAGTAAERLTQATAAYKAAPGAYWQAIRDALAAGLDVGTVQNLAECSRSRIYQVRDRRRTGPGPVSPPRPEHPQATAHSSTMQP